LCHVRSGFARGRLSSPPLAPKDEPGPEKDSGKKDFFAESFRPSGSSSTGRRPMPDGGPQENFKKTSRKLQENRSTQMKRTLIRYKTRPETTEQNQRLIEDVFAELQAKSPEGIRYMALKLADGSFLHFVETGDGDSPLPAMEAFRRFQSGIRERCIEPPQPLEAVVVGNYRMLGER
jgi:hypothetical protein